MDTNRLASTLSLVREAIETGGIRKRLATLQQRAVEAAANPSVAEMQNQFMTALQDLEQSLRQSPLNHSPISVIRAAEHLGISKLLPSNLLNEINIIIQARPFLLPQAQQKIEILSKSVTDSVNTITRASDFLTRLGIKPTQIDDDLFELGVMMPSTFMNDDLRTLSDHLKKWVYHIDGIQRATSRQISPTIPLVGASSGSFDFYVSISPEGAIAFLVIARGCISIFKSVREAETNRKKLAEMGYPKSVLDPMEDFEKELIEKHKQEIRDNVLKKSNQQPNTTEYNESKNALDRAIDYILKSMNRGVDIEVSSPPKADVQKAEVETEIKLIRDDIEKMRKELIDGIKSLPKRDTPILQLPPASDEEPQTTQTN